MNEQMNVEDLLLKEIGTLFTKLEGLEAGTEEYSKVNGELVKLIDRATTMEKFRIESDDLMERFRMEQENLKEKFQMEQENLKEKFQMEQENLKEKFDEEQKIKREQMAEEQKDRIVKYGIMIGSTLLEVTLLVWGAKKSWKFEETGTITSTPGRKFIGNMLGVFKPKKVM